MRIGLIGQDFNPGKTGGTETYLRSLVSGLPKIDHENQYITYVPRNYISDIMPESNNSSILGIQDKPLHKKVIHRLSKLNSWDKYSSNNLDLVHFCFQHADQITKCPSIVTFHDIQDSYLPGNFTKEESGMRARFNQHAIDDTDHIIAISEYTKKCLVEKYSVDKTNISVVYHGIEDAFFESKKKISTQYGKYFFYPAASWPHKNHINLLKAFKSFVETYPDFNLVLSGAAKQENKVIQAFIRTHKLEKNVFILNYVKFEKLPTLYASAHALVFPSLFEGFGIPVIEAMASGCPVIASNTTSVPEVAGNAALYFDPTSSVDIARAMKEIVRNDTVREQLIISGYEQANKFTKSKMVESTLQVYRKVAKM